MSFLRAIHPKRSHACGNLSHTDLWFNVKVSGDTIILEKNIGRLFSLWEFINSNGSGLQKIMVRYCDYVQQRLTLRS